MVRRSAGTFEIEGSIDDSSVRPNWYSLRTLARKMLNHDGLTPDGVESMTLSELGNASRTVDKALELGSAFSTSLQRIANDEGVQYTREGQEFVRRDLLDLKRRILSRISLLRPQEELTAIKELIEQSDLEPKVRDSILESIDNSATLAEDDAEALKVTETELDRQALDFKERTMALSERRSKMRRAWFERESIASIVGAFLLLLLGVALVVAMFIGTTPTEIVTSAFLLILGYFFGQATKRDKGE